MRRRACTSYFKVSGSVDLKPRSNMDCAPNVNIFRELQVVHDTGYFSSDFSPEEDWQQVY